MIKKLTSGVLAKWALTGAAYAYLMAIGMAYLFAQADQTSLKEIPEVILQGALGALGLIAAWYYAKLRHCVSDSGGDGPQFDHERLRFRAVLSILFSVQVAILLFGIVLLRSNLTAGGLACLTVALVVTVLTVIYVVRTFRLMQLEQGRRKNRSLASLLAWSYALAIVLTLLIIALFEYRHGRTSAAYLFLGWAVVLGVSNVASVVEMIRKREEQLQPEKRVFSMAMAIFGCATVVITSLVACGAFILSFQSPTYVAIAAIVCVIFTFLMFRTAKKAEAKFGHANA
ncbi:MAG: hypothetical protein IPH75_14090 [bacterium]|nr:hypothetical protein [bacterium]